MIKLDEKIKINENEKEKQEICIYSDGIVIFTTDKSHSWENKEIIKYEDFIEKTEIQKRIFYYKASYFDENGEEHLLINDETTREIELLLCLQYKKEVKTSVYSSKTREETVYKNLSVSNLNLGLEIVKKINNYIKKEETIWKRKEYPRGNTRKEHYVK